MSDRIISIPELRALATGKQETPDGWSFVHQETMLALIEVAEAAERFYEARDLAARSDLAAALERLDFGNA